MRQIMMMKNGYFSANFGIAGTTPSEQVRDGKQSRSRAHLAGAFRNAGGMRLYCEPAFCSFSSAFMSMVPPVCCTVSDAGSWVMSGLTVSPSR